VTSQLLLAVPMCLLYELGLLIAPWFAKATTAPVQDNS
jgi:sec-independent protein translocase protein TatC